MPASTIRAANDLDEFRTHIRPAEREYIVLKRGAFAARVVKIDLYEVWLQKISETLPRSWCVETSRIGLVFPTFPVEDLSASVEVLVPGRTQWHCTPARSELAAFSLPTESVAKLGPLLAGCDIVISRDLRSLRVRPAAMDRLRRLHRAAIHLAETAPEVVANADAARGLEAALAELFIDCLTQESTETESTAGRRRRIIVERLHELAGEHADEPLFLSEVCEKLAVSRRTLDLCCREQMGISPKRYLTLRRLHLARAALRRASPEQTSVTEIATSYGFWELGRFAVTYRTMFGEAPSTTLRFQP